MEGPGITEAEEAELNRLISKAIDNDKDAFNELLKHHWLWELLDGIINHAVQQYKVDANELLSHVLTQLNFKITTIRNDNDRSPHVCLAGWCRSVVHHRCQVLIRPRSKEVSIDDERATFDLPSTWMSPEEELERKEWDAIREGGEPEVFWAVWRVFRTLEPADAEVILMWADGATLKHMADRFEVKCTATMDRHLKKIQKIFFKELMKVGVAGLGEAWAEESGVTQMAEHSTRDDRDGLRELIGHCLRDMLGRGPEPPPAAFA
jgi:hypothetical protein